MKHKNDEDFILLEAISLTFYNVPPADIVDAVYENPVGYYRDEKIEAVNRGFDYVWSQIDLDHKRRLIDFVRDRYEDEAKARLARAEED